MAVGGLKLGYAFMADRAKLFVGSKIRKGINIAAGCVMVAIRVFLSTKTQTHD
ncbi:hypothetical protein [Leptolyngbya sp. FACHB-261]|uniref:hypothetical protein n=1 Tax=Leptolyngbya sp. FACHB-261 TaxID=2692806 RepID=UPI0018F04121|nr:hypothetical protein [Leptolyngbya sp. FACHB-261]